MTPFSRRSFLQYSSSAALAGTLAKFPLAQVRSRTANDVIPPPDEAYLQSLALRAIDAARAAGASFADIRITYARYFMVGAVAAPPGYPPRMSEVMVGYPTAFGIRAIVDGAWGFASEVIANPDVITATARKAVTVARANATRHRTKLDLAPVPPTKGSWDTPMLRDPLTVPFHEMGEITVEGIKAALKVPGIYQTQCTLDWRRPTTIFASTEGSLITQRFSYAAPGGVVNIVVPGFDTASVGVMAGSLIGPYGYEGGVVETIPQRMFEAAERGRDSAIHWNKLPMVEDGRYDLVLAPGAVPSFINGALSDALMADYAMGYQMEGGISFAAPPSEMLGRYQIASPLITLRADRTRPNGLATVGWDEEGVKPDAYTLVDKGVITDYHTNRETGAELGSWYQSKGEAVRSHGCMRRNGGNIPLILPPNLTLEPGPDSTTEADLVRDVKKGFLLRDASGGMDHQSLSGQFYSRSAFAIRNGKVGEQVRDMGIQILMPQFWKNVDAIGGAKSSVTLPVGSDAQADQDPTQPFVLSSNDVVPIRARRITVMNLGRAI